MHDNNVLAHRSRRRRSGLGVAAVLAAAPLALVGCTAGVTTVDRDGVALFVDAGFLTGDEAAISGKLSVAPSGCVGITTDSGESYPVVWPGGTVLRESSPVSIEIPGVGVKGPGDAIKGAGGAYPVDKRDVLRPIGERCDWTGEVIGVRFD